MSKLNYRAFFTAANGDKYRLDFRASDMLEAYKRARGIVDERGDFTSGYKVVYVPPPVRAPDEEDGKLVKT